MVVFDASAKRGVLVAKCRRVDCTNVRWRQTRAIITGLGRSGKGIGLVGNARDRASISRFSNRVLIITNTTYIVMDG